ncbi:phosphopyruvate hydratase [Patescibacteria group bacterium]
MAKIYHISARSILDSTGWPTVEATVWLDNGAFGVSSVSSNTTKSKNEPLEVRDNDPSNYHGKSVEKAVSNINTIIAPRLKGLDPSRQSQVDKTMIEIDGTANKSKLGANAILPVSQAIAKAGASLFHMPLYEYFGKKYQLTTSYTLPSPIVAIISGGVFGIGGLDFQEFQIIPSSRHSFSDSLRISSEIFHSLEKTLIANKAIHSVGAQGGFTPNLYTNIDALEIIYEAIKTTSYYTGQDVFLGIDAAADDIYKNNAYNISDRSKKISKKDIIEFYKELNSKYHLFVLEDPLIAADVKGWGEITFEVGKDTLIIADKLTSGNKELTNTAIQQKACTAVSIKPNQIGTVSEIIEYISLIKSSGLNCVVSSRVGATNDTFISDLAVGTGAEYVKLGAPTRGERVIQYNRLLQIEASVTSSKQSQ